MAKRGRPKMDRLKAKCCAIGFRCTQKLYDEIVKSAAQNGRSISSEIEIRLENEALIQRFLDNR